MTSAGALAVTGRVRGRIAVVALLVVLHVVGAWAAAASDFSIGRQMVTGDNMRYHEIANAPGAPYRDHEVEFPPVTWLYLDAIAETGNLQTTGRLLVITQLVADLAVAAALAWGWGRRAAVAWLALLVPFLWDGWIFARVDLLSVALAVGGLALVQRGREAPGGALLAVAVFAKVWPIVLVPWLLLRGRARALVSCAVTGALGAAAWLAYAGTAGPDQVASFRGATGWQIESLPGSVELLLTGRQPVSQANALRIGVMSGPARAVLMMALGAAVVGAWWLAARAQRRGVGDAVELGAVVAVVAMLVLAPILSPQYIVWLVPFVAVLTRRPIIATLAVVIVVTAVLADNTVYGELVDGHTGWQLLLVARNALVVAVGVLAVHALRPSPGLPAEARLDAERRLAGSPTHS